MNVDSARALLKINTSLLETEVAGQAVLQEKINTQFSHAQSRRDLAKLEVDQITALAGDKLRNQKDDNNKPYSETRIAMMVQNEDDVVETKKKLITAIEETELWRGLLDAVKSRGWMLRDLVQMALSNAYTPTPDSATYELGRKRLAEAREERARNQAASGEANA